MAKILLFLVRSFLFLIIGLSLIGCLFSASKGEKVTIDESDNYYRYLVKPNIKGNVMSVIKSECFLSAIEDSCTKLNSNNREQYYIGKNGNLITKIESDGDTLYEVDSYIYDGKILSQKIRASFHYVNYTTYTFNSNGKIARGVAKGAEDPFSEEFYVTRGNVGEVNVEWTAKSGYVFQKLVYIFDTDGKLTEFQNFVRDTLVFKDIYTYDDRGNWKTRTREKLLSEIVFEYEYERYKYDSAGNWIQRDIIWRGSEEFIREMRTILYN